MTSGDPWVEQFGFQDTDALVAGYPDEEGGTPITHVLDTTDGNVIAAFPVCTASTQTDDPQVAVVIYNDWNSPETIGLYDTERRIPAGPAVDPGVTADEVWTDGRLALVVSGRNPATHDRSRRRRDRRAIIRLRLAGHGPARPRRR